MKQYKLIFLLIIFGQVFLTTTGYQFFPLSNYIVFSDVRDFNGQKIYRIVSTAEFNDENTGYVPEGTLFEISSITKGLFETMNLAPSEVYKYFPFPVVAIDEFVLIKEEGKLFKKKRIYQRGEDVR